ncbi:ATP-binding cassette domain-containing protein [Dyadobacter sp. CY312]|uniref:ABC transporter ATP-binding protein n=1 Tax=Dyadobacter sp. CY312 TaxID=2907303 RepID=UPI00286D6F24|nr:ATP-binding cassette domain-containing protein [Dyadobacter sp. CY312]
MISVRNLSKNFGGVDAVSDISFEVSAGNTMVLLGTSGCGKTTTLKMLNRLIEPTSGEIRIDDRDVFSAKPEILRRGIGYVSQNNGLFPHFTVAENIAVVPRLLKWDRSKTEKRTTELLEQLRLPFVKYAHKYPDELSGGQKQRVSLARALVADPSLLLMDEPFGALDPITRADIRKEFLELPELKRKTILLVTHDVQEAFELGDQISLMDKGRIVQSGSAQDLIFKPANDFVSNFFSHHKLQLELSSLKIHEIWHALRDAAPDSNSTAITSNSSFWEVLELLSDHKEKVLTIKNAENDIKSVSLENIQSAYTRIKQNR